VGVGRSLTQCRNNESSIIRIYISRDNISETWSLKMAYCCFCPKYDFSKI
jgi:hypothetical protein